MMKYIQELRHRTDAPIVDCKTALQLHPPVQSAAGKADLSAAIQWLNEKGVASASRKSVSDRETAFGSLILANASTADNSDKTPRAVIVELMSETDFAAKSDKFVEDAVMIQKKIESLLAETQWISAHDFLEDVVKPNEEIEKIRLSLVAKLGEKLNFGRAFDITPSTATVSPSTITIRGRVTGHYMHNEVRRGSLVGGIGALVCLAKYQKQKISESGPLVAPVPMSGEELNTLQKDAGDLARHCLMSMSSDIPLLDQRITFGDSSSFQTDEDENSTLKQWLKKRRYVLYGSTVLKIGAQAVRC